MGGNWARACGAGRAMQPVPRKAHSPDNARREGFFGGDERQRFREVLVEGGIVERCRSGKVPGCTCGERPGGAEWSATQRPKKHPEPRLRWRRNEFQSHPAPHSGSKLSFGAVLTTPVAAKRVSVQSACLYWQQNEFRSRCGLIRTYKSPSYDKSRTQKRPLFSPKRGQTRPLCHGGNDFTAPKHVSLPTGTSRLLRNVFFNQKGHTSTPQNGSRPSQAPGNEAAAIRGRTILITTRASAKRVSRPHSLATRSNKSTKRDRQKRRARHHAGPAISRAARAAHLPTPYRVT